MSTSLSLEQVSNLIKLSHQTNELVNPLWMGANYDFELAAKKELSEILDQLNWKWWSSKPPAARKQVEIEVADYLIFQTSDLLINNYTDQEVQEAWTLSERVEEFVDLYKSEPLHGLVNLYMGRIQIPFEQSLPFIVEVLGFDWQSIYQTVIQKQVLNRFRQANGYKQGSYIKIWNGFEDNQVLENIMSHSPELDPEGIYEQLARIYQNEVLPHGN